MKPADPPFSGQQEAGYFQHTRKEIEPFLPARIGSVLEIGCGAGATMAWLRTVRQIDRAVGIELSPAAAEKARAVFDEVVVADLGVQMPSLDGAGFDLVLALDVLEHLPDPWSALRLLHAHMAADGLIVASIPNVAHYSVAVPLLLKGSWAYTDAGLLDRTHLRFFTRETTLALFEQTGFTVRQVGMNRQFPQLAASLGLSGQRWSWYNEKLFRALLPARLFDMQYLVAAGRRA